MNMIPFFQQPPKEAFHVVINNAEWF